MAQLVAVQFLDATEETIITFLGITTNEPNPEEWPNYAVITTADERYATYYNAQWPMVQVGLPLPNS